MAQKPVLAPGNPISVIKVTLSSTAPGNMINQSKFVIMYYVSRAAFVLCIFVNIKILTLKVV